MRIEVAVSKKIPVTGEVLAYIRVESGWPMWLGPIQGGDPILLGWPTATQAVNALKNAGKACSNVDCTCWAEYGPLVVLYYKENPRD